jgi:hypothetical protein
LESGDIEQKKSIPRKGGHPLIIYKRSKKSS